MTACRRYDRASIDMSPDGVPIDPETCWTCGYYHGQHERLFQITEPEPDPPGTLELLILSMIESAGWQCMDIWTETYWLDFYRELKGMLDRSGWSSWPYE